MDQRQIKQAGLKVTGPRLKILEILEQSERRHLSAEDVYRELLGRDEEIGLATVYRVLTQFESAGLVCRRHFEGGQARFELNGGDHHDHLVCTRCGTVIEFCDDLIEKRQERVAAAHGFRIQEHSLVLRGICKSCDAASSAGGKSR